MINLSVCFEMFWEGLAPGEKIRKLQKLGFSAFEFWGWKNKDTDEIKAAAEETGMKLAVCGLAVPGPIVKEHGESDLVEALEESAQAVKHMGGSCLIVTTGNEVPEQSFDDTRRNVVDNMKVLAKAAADEGITLVLEPLNPIVDHPGYWLNTTADAASIIEEVDSPHARILYDIYHQQITEGNVIDTITAHLPLIGHFHSAGVPGRHELAGGELDYRNIFSRIDASGYDGYVGLEFSPTGSDEDALAQAMALAS